MNTFSVTVHFRTNDGSEWRAEGQRGGYCTFLGRYSKWKEFFAAIDGHLGELGCFRIEADDRKELSGREELDEEEWRERFDSLASHPLQYGSHFLYQNDDA